MTQPRVLLEDNHLLVVDKPAGLPTAGVVDRDSLVNWARRYVKEKYHKPGNVYIGVVSRLDTVTSGVIALARTSKCASRLSDQIRRAAVGKHYLAVLHGELPSRSGQLVDQVFKDDAAHRMRVAASGKTEDAKEAVLHYQCLHQWEDAGCLRSLVSVRLITGRKHQIRVQFAARGAVVVGDRKYGDDGPPVGDGIALHCAAITFQHPTLKHTVAVQSLPPDSWSKLLPSNWTWDGIVQQFDR